jgi:hypothetical protein
MKQRRTRPIAYQRSKSALLRIVDGEAFLLHRGMNSICHVNVTALAVWRALASPQSADSISSMLKLAYPQHHMATLRKHCRAVLREFEDNSLIHPIAFR